MSRVIKKTKCPNCAKLGRDRKGDNLAIYDDSGEYCFSCGYTNHSKTTLKQPQTADLLSPNTYPLPNDSDTAIPVKCLEWLKSFHITINNVINNNILWSPSRELLIFPLENAWQGRYFGKENKPKWDSRGKLHEIIHGFNLEIGVKEIYLVEDIISAIRLGNCELACMCLFGSMVSNDTYARLSRLTGRLIFWLDYDKRKSAAEQSLKIQSYGASSSIIITEQDPKCYTDEQIKYILFKHR